MGEGGCAIPGEICPFAIWLPTSREVGKNGQKSAEGIVAAAHGGEGPNMEDRKGANYLAGRRRRRQDG
jgi:hypothetical protein